ncbi:PEP-CTERM sorting domain-containing protein [Alteromonas sp.]|nr:PEP-CTERM sorting domain-containing protein [Alteromonas sp.]
MKNKFLIGATLASLISTSASAALISPNVELVVRGDNGAIDLFSGSVSGISGVDYFNLGAPVSDYGFAVLNSNGSISNFSNADTSGSINGHSVGSVVESGDRVTVTGTYGSFGTFERTYSQVGSLDVFAINTSFTSMFNGLFTLLQYETFDPDQGSGIGRGTRTYNDVVEVTGVKNTDGSTLLASTSVDTARQNPFFLASTSAFATEAGGVFEINSVARLLDVVNSPVDANDALADLGAHTIIKQDFLMGETFNWTTYIGTSAGGLADGLAVLADGVTTDQTEIPEPSSLAIIGLGLAGLAVRRRIKK